MKTIVKITTVITLFIGSQITAQNPPATPQTPKSTKVVRSSETSSSYSYSNSNDNLEDEYSSSSISVKSTNSTYKFRASFTNKKNAKIKQLLKKELSKIKNISTKNTNRWTYYRNDEKVFECKLSDGSLRLFLDKDLSSKKMENNIINLGEELKHFISNGSSTKAALTNLNHAKIALEEAEKNYKRAQKNYNKAKEN